MESWVYLHYWLNMSLDCYRLLLIPIFPSSSFVTIRATNLNPTSLNRTPIIISPLPLSHSLPLILAPSFSIPKETSSLAFIPFLKARTCQEDEESLRSHWFLSNHGERLGVYSGHAGDAWSLCVSGLSRKVFGFFFTLRATRGWWEGFGFATSGVKARGSLSNESSRLSTQEQLRDFV